MLDYMVQGKAEKGVNVGGCRVSPCACILNARKIFDSFDDGEWPL